MVLGNSYIVWIEHAGRDCELRGANFIPALVELSNLNVNADLAQQVPLAAAPTNHIRQPSQRHPPDALNAETRRQTAIK